MSIWCSWPSVGRENRRYNPRGGHVLTYADGFSNHYPDQSGDYELPATVGIAHVAPWCVTGHDQSGEGWTCSGCGEDHEYGESVGGFVRLSVDANAGLSFWGPKEDRPQREPIHASVVMDEGAVRALVADLTDWLDRPKVHAADEVAR